MRQVALRTPSNCGRAKSFRASHGTLSSAPLTSQERVPLSMVSQRLDSQDVQLHEIQNQLTHIISWIHAQSIPSFLPSTSPKAQLFCFFLCAFIDLDVHFLLISCILNTFLFYFYIYGVNFPHYLLHAFLSLYHCYFAIFVTKMGRQLNYLNKEKLGEH